MKKNNFLSGITMTLMSTILLCGLSACSLQERFSKKQAASQTVTLENFPQTLQPPVSNPDCPVTIDEPSYRLGSEDEVTVQIFGEPDLSAKYTLQNSGVVNIPLIGETTLSGCTLKQAERLLYAKFTDGYLVNPSIALSVSKHRPFYIIGEIREPGRYDYIVDMNVLQAVALAGGFTYRANKKTAKVLKNYINNQPVYKDILVEKEIQPGDVIFIKERFF